MSVPQGRTIILSEHYFLSLRDGKYNLRLFRGMNDVCLNYGSQTPKTEIMGT